METSFFAMKILHSYHNPIYDSKTIIFRIECQVKLSAFLIAVMLILTGLSVLTEMARADDTVAANYITAKRK